MQIQDFFEQYRKECEAANGGRPVCIPKPDDQNGFRGAAVMFINERPGRLGAGKSDKISFENDDPTAHWFRELLALTGLNRKDIFITNACLYFPQEAGYTDRPPRGNELAACAPILKKQIEYIRPRLIVSLGNTALAALRRVFPESRQLRRFTLKRCIGTVVSDTAIPIYPLYHTSGRARVSRNKEQQRRDWKRIPGILGLGA